MRILIALNHPAHYYLFKYISKGLINLGNEVRFVIREKDILENLLQSEKVPFHKLTKKGKRTNSKLSVIIKGVQEFIIQDYKLLNYVRKFKPDIMLGTDIAITHIGSLKKIPSIVFNEDDYEINKLFCKASYPFASLIISPECTSVGKYSHKKISYNGIQKLAYLHPKYFKPDPSVLDDLGLSLTEPFYVIRLVSLTAGHDIEGHHKGIDRNILDQVINRLKPHGKIFITSEIGLDEQYQKYTIKLPLNKIHDMMAFAQIFIGDSQSMCVEAGIIGTPFIRFNDYVGKIEVLNNMENKYNLGFGIKTSEPTQLYQKLDELLNIPDLKNIWKIRTEEYLKDKIDLTSFIVWFINNYPASTTTLKEIPDYQFQFK